MSKTPEKPTVLRSFAVPTPILNKMKRIAKQNRHSVNQTGIMLWEQALRTRSKNKI